MVGIKKDNWSKYMYVLQDVPEPEWFFFLFAISLAKLLRKFFHFFKFFSYNNNKYFFTPIWNSYFSIYAIEWPISFIAI